MASICESFVSLSELESLLHILETCLMDVWREDLVGVWFFVNSRKRRGNSFRETILARLDCTNLLCRCNDLPIKYSYSFKKTVKKKYSSSESKHYTIRKNGI